MTLLFVLFSAFAITIPVVLESRRTRGDHILKQVGKEVMESKPVRGLSDRLTFLPQAGVAVVASATSVAVLVAILWVILWAVRLVF